MKRIIGIALGLAIVLGLPTATFASGHEAKAKAYFEKSIKGWISAPDLVNAVVQQNINHIGLTAQDVAHLDFRWRQEKARGGGDLMDSKLKNHLASFLRGIRAASNGIIVEIFVMDNIGLNVGQTDPTGDYMQGDEAKWKKTYRMGPQGLLIDDVEEEDGKNISQLSASIVNEKGREVGAVTIAINVDKL